MVLGARVSMSLSRADLADLVEYTQRAKRQKCTWLTPRCIGRVASGCTCEAGMRDHDPSVVVEAWSRGYKTVGFYLAAKEAGVVRPRRRAADAEDLRPSAPVIPLRPR